MIPPAAPRGAGRDARALLVARPLALAVVLIAFAALAALLPVAPAAAAPARPRGITAAAAIVVEPETGDIIWARNADRRRPIASTTKLMTALLTLERASLSDVFTAPAYSGAPAESLIGLRAGERMKVSDLLRGLLLASGNDAAETLARGVSGSVPAFVRAMNRRARQLGLDNTRYANPIGLDSPRNYSSAADLVKLAAIDRANAFFRRTVARGSATLLTGDVRRTIVNRNTLVRSTSYVNGVKTGHTSVAGYILVGSATRNGVTLLTAVLGTPSEAARNSDTLKLMRYGFGTHRRVTALPKGKVLARASIEYTDGELELVSTRAVERVAKVGERFRVIVKAPAQVRGPIETGTRLGTATVLQRGKVVARVPLVARERVPEAGIVTRLKDYFGHGTTLLLLALVVGCSLVSVLLVRRGMRRSRDRPAEAEPIA